jgi:ribosomal-protein-alanine N-acetyltransferase
MEDEMQKMPELETKRLIIRPFKTEDLEAAHRLFDVELREADFGSDKMETLEERADWLQWAARNDTQLAKLYQPPYGDRAIILKSNKELIGACGFVPCLNAFEQIPSFAPEGHSRSPGCNTPEFGLFYAISPSYQGQGYATEAAQALVDYAFQQLHLKRIIAETNYDNLASINVMKKLGMRIETNPGSAPAWLQVVGVLENRTRDTGRPASE